MMVFRRFVETCEEPIVSLETHRISHLLRRRSLGGFAVVLALGGAPLLADAADAAALPPDEPFVVDDEIFVEAAPPDIPTSNTVAAKLPLLLEQTPASVTVIPAATFEDQGGFVLGDALENVSGMNVQTFNGVFDFFVVRGLDSVSSGLIQTDGVPEPEASFYQLYNVDRVEVLKGPGAFLYGDSPLVGTINLVRKQPETIDFGQARLAGGSFGTLEGSLDVNAASAGGRWGFRVNGLWQESDGYRDDKGSENLAVNPAFTWRPDDRTSVNANLEFVDTRYSTDAGLPILFDGSVAAVPRTTSYQSPFDVSDQEINRAQVDVERRVSSDVTVRNKTYWRSLDWVSKGTLFGGVFPTVEGLEAARFLSSLDSQQSFFGNQLELLWQVETGAITHNLLAGLELARRTDEFGFDVFALPSINLFLPVETATLPLFPLPGQATAADATSEVLAPYVIDQIVLSEKVQLLLGARWDTIRFDNDVSGIERDNDEVSPMIGLVVAPTANLTFYANAGEAFALPSTFVVDDQRQPEESRQIEVGVKKSFADGKLRASLAAFRIERENIAIPDAFGLPRQNGDQRSEGLELELTAVPRAGMRASFSYAYTESELTRFAETVLVGFFPPTFLTVDRSGNTSPFAPEHLANLWLSQRFENGFGLGIGGRYLSEQFIAEDNAFEIDAYATLEAAVFYETGPWRFQLNLQNLTDEQYLTRGVGKDSVIPAPGFGSFGSVRLRF